MRDRFPWILALIYAALFTWLGSIRYNVHRNFVDFGIFAQTVASVFGCFCNAIEGSHWAFHFSPILYIVGAIVYVWHSPLALIAVSAIGGALAIPPVYALVLRRGDRTIARYAALTVFLYPPLQGLTFNDFHENALAPAAVLWAFWAFDAGRLTFAVFAALIAMCIKEDQAIFMAIAGGAAAWVYRGTARATAGTLVAVCGVVLAAVFFCVIQPHAAANPNWQPVRFYAWSSGDLQTLVPRGIAERLGFIILVFLPLLFLPFRSSVIWLAAAPFAEVLLSRMSTTYTTGSHYAGAWIGYVLAAFAYAVRNLPLVRVRSLVIACCVLCVVELAIANPLHPGMNLRAWQPRDVALDRALSRLPSDIPVATQEEAYTHLALDDPNARLLPEDARDPLDACFVLVDRAFPDSPRLQEYAAAFAQLVAAHRYALVEQQDSIELYRRKGSCR
ncbi:MAG: DUF2079 domain-containing protein [Candidatus Eremiobacteraeota bacterium]|nr:DUF2079 domain-containing protein [Candidatus Eremiobacteraeota bacterium]